MFSNMNKFDMFLKLNKYNINFMLLFFMLFFFMLSVGHKYNLWSVTTSLHFFKNAVLCIFSMSFMMFLFYLFAVIHFKNMLFIQNFVYCNYSMNYLNCNVMDTPSMMMIYLCYLIGFISILTLGDRFWGANYQLSLLFLYFVMIMNLLCQALSLFELFLYYELLLLPSMFFVYKSGYTRKSHQASIYFFIWTQLGSLMVLAGILYMSSKCGTTEYYFIKNFKFTDLELYYMYLMFFFGFGVKVPLWPFHFWLMKVHVEAPSGFSIFLSGFLVKSAVYCFYKIMSLLSINYFYVLPIVVCLLGLLDSSLKMWVQTDIKKLMAYATVQEMNAIYLLFNFGDSWAVNAGLIFLLAHGLLSALMFFLVECIYKRFNSSSLYKVYGVSQLFPNLSMAIWCMLMLFFGFPGTLKFYAEIQLVMMLASNDLLLTLFVLTIFMFMNTVGFGRCWFSVLYGHPGNTAGGLKSNLDLTTEELLMILLLVFLSMMPAFFMYLI